MIPLWTLERLNDGRGAKQGVGDGSRSMVGGRLAHSVGAPSSPPVDSLTTSRFDLHVDSREGAGFAAERGRVKVRFALGLSSDCSLRLLKLGVSVFLVGVGGMSPSSALDSSLDSPKSIRSSPSRLRRLPRRDPFAAEPRWKMERPFPGWPKVSAPRLDGLLKGVEGTPAKEFRLLPFL